jgi:hypothetical protein
MATAASTTIQTMVTCSTRTPDRTDAARTRPDSSAVVTPFKAGVIVFPSA